MEFEKVLKTVVETASGYKLHALEKPLNAAVPCTVYKTFSDNPVIAHSGDTSNRKVRVQLTCIAGSYNDLAGLVDDIETALFANTTDWQVSLPLDTKIDDKEDGFYYSIREYYIRFNK